MSEATLIQVKNFFEFDSAAQFSKEWKELSEQDKNDLKKGIGNRSLNY